MKNIPNILTLIRIFSIPIIVLLILSSSLANNLFAFFLFIGVSLTDYLDGAVARKMNLVSDFGKMLDPIADKLLIVCTIITLIIKGNIAGLSLIPAFIIISREIFISGLREFNASKKNGAQINVSFLGKMQTSIQMISLILLILSLLTANYQIYFLNSGIFTLWVAMIFTVISGYQYYKKIYN